MAVLALNGGLGGGGGTGGPPRRSPVTRHLTPGRLALAGGALLAAFVIWTLFSAQIVTKRPNEMKTTQVVLPPPPPPPPPPPKPQEKPPEPTPMDAPVDQPVDTPPPEAPSPNSDPVQGDNALTAREGAGPSNYGLAAGDGSGTRIGGRPGGGGGNGFAAYGQLVTGHIRRAAQADRELGRGRYRIDEIEISVDADGRITRVRVLRGGDDKRNARLAQLLVGSQISQRPPAGMPTLRVAMNGG